MLSVSRSSSPSRLTRFQGDLKSISNSNLSLNLGVISQSRSISKRNYTRSVSRRNLNVRTASELALQKSLILEVLNAQPSLRDSKSYLNSFAPRKSNQNVNVNGRVTHSNPINPTFTSPQHWNHQRPNHPPPAPIPLAPHHHDPTPSLHPTSTSTPPSTTATSTGTTLPNISLSDTIESSVASPIQQHTAIVKIQGPFTNRQLASIADGMVYLKKLGLVSVIVMDSEDWIDNSPSFASEDGRWLQSGNGRNSQDDFDREDIKPWLSRNENQDQDQDQDQENKNGTNGQDIKGKGKMRGNEFKGEEKFDSKKLRTLATLRKRMLNDTYRLTELLIEKGANALPFQRPIMKVDPIEARKAHLESLSYSQSKSHPESLQDQSSSSSNINIKSSTYNPNCFSSSSTNKKRKSKFSLDNPSSSFDSRSPLISDDSLKSLRSSLALDQIPILAPFALYSDPDQNGAERSIPVKADDLMVGLARDMANYGRKMEEKLRERERLNELMKENNGVEDEEDVGSGSEFGGIDDNEVDMTPLRLMVINREGGIPSHARGGNPHLAINLASESSHIENSFIWNQTHPTALSNLKMVSDCLSYMPQTSSGVVVSHRSPRSLIANLITNKAAHSPSLPHSLLASKKDVRHTPTIIRPGLDVKVLENFEEIDQEKMKNLLEEAFNRELDFENYFSRLKESLDFVIITGDYSGAAIVTKEFSPNDDRENSEPIAYLDKFAVLPSLQGSGTVDFLWGALRDEVQGLGLLDSINENGGKEGRGKGRDLVWKSRSDNPVNRWYYERSNGFMKIDTQAKKVQDGNGVEEEQVRTPAWSMFWCDSEERISEMAGERKLKAEASREDVIENMNNSHLHDDLWSISQTEKERRNLERQDESDQEKVNDSSKRRVRGHLEEERYSEEEDIDESEDFDEREWNKKTSGNKRNRISRKDLRKALEAYGRDLKDTDSSSASSTVSSEIVNLFSNNQKLLPIIAPEEEGRLQRWAACMATIPSAWK